MNQEITKPDSKIEDLLQWATPSLAAEVLKSFADTPSPSQTASWTMGPIVESYLKQWNLTSYSWEPNFKGTGNGVLSIGESNNFPVWILAHWDVISFLIQDQLENGYRLIPFHHHMMMDGNQPGLALRYNLQKQEYEVISNGVITGGEHPVYHPNDSVELRPGDRIAYHTPVEALSETVFTGQMDNAPGCTGALVAGAILSKMEGVSVRICFVDEEEGPVSKGNTAFARGSRRLLHHLPPPHTAIVVDHHTVAKGNTNPHMGDGALIREYASQARGGVTPPWLYTRILELARIYSETVSLNQNQFADVSRSDCVSMMEATPNVILCGPPTVGRHYVDGVYKCSSYDVAHLARSLALIASQLQ